MIKQNGKDFMTPEQFYSKYEVINMDKNIFIYDRKERKLVDAVRHELGEREKGTQEMFFRFNVIQYVNARG